MKKLLIILVASLVCTYVSAQPDAKKIVSQMTLQEKAEMVIGHLWNMDASNTEGSLFDYPGLGMPINGVKRLGIPVAICSDGSYGLKKYIKMGNGKYGSTGFPIPIGMASSWNIPLVESVGEAFGNEGLEYGVDILLGPALNIQRDPLCGRNFEYYSEDPLLSGFMASAYVDAIQRQGLGATPKHYAANSQETNRIVCDSRVSPRALREIYLRAFEHVVKCSNPWSIMTGYNRLNGVQCGENSELMEKVTRGEWGFKGFFMTDFGGEGWSPVQVAAGNDLVMPGSTYHVQNILDAVKKGELSEKDMDKCCVRILEFLFKTPHYRKYAYSRNPDLEAHARVARQAALETFVMLKNEAALPLSGVPAFYGCGSYDTKASGIGSGKVTCDYVINIADGFEKKNEAIAAFYDKYIRDGKRAATKGMKFKQRSRTLERLLLPESLPAEDVLAQAVKESSIGIYTITRNAGEGADRKPVEGDWLLSKTERDVMQKLADAYHKAGKKLVVILNTASGIETASWKNIPDAILMVWLPGQEGGNAIADVLTGKQSPSGRLTSTFPIRYEDCPSYGNFPMGNEEGQADYDANGYQADADNMKQKKGEKKEQAAPINTIFENGKTRHIDKPESEFIKNVDYTNYEEDIYVGYRYFSTFNVPVSYPFGYGLSYTTFSYGKPTVKAVKGGYDVTVKVTNTGKASGKEVVQIYAEAPNNKAGRPVRELVAFGKTQTLAPGASETVKLHFNQKDIAWFDNSASAWRLDAGKYGIVCAANVADKGKSTTLVVKKALIVEKTTNALQPKVKLNLKKRTK